MKNKIFIIVIVLLGFMACEELGNIDIDTSFAKEITIDVEKPAEMGIIKSTKIEGYSFYKADTIDISDNEDIEEYINNIKDLDIYSVSCTLNGIPQGEEITELTIEAIEAGMSVTLNNIAENNNSISLDISGSVLKALGEQLLTYEKMEVSVSGISSYAPMRLSVKLNFDTTVKANALE